MSPRGTTNRNERGSAANRRARREWLVETYRAEVDLYPGDGYPWLGKWHLEAHNARTPITQIVVPIGEGSAACRCFRCGLLLTVDTITVDRIIPGCKGGTYRRNNIRPACGHCNSVTGIQVREAIRRSAA